MDEKPVLGTTLLSSATTTTFGTLNASTETTKMLQITQAYVESRNEEELHEFIVKLEEKGRCLEKVNSNVQLKKVIYKKS